MGFIIIKLKMHTVLEHKPSNHSTFLYLVQGLTKTIGCSVRFHNKFIARQSTQIICSKLK